MKLRLIHVFAIKQYKPVRYNQCECGSFFLIYGSYVYICILCIMVYGFKLNYHNNILKYIYMYKHSLYVFILSTEIKLKHANRVVRKYKYNVSFHQLHFIYNMLILD